MIKAEKDHQKWIKRKSTKIHIFKRILNEKIAVWDFANWVCVLRHLLVLEFWISSLWVGPTYIFYINFFFSYFFRSGAFSHLKFVTTLALSHCDIETVEDGAFEGMEALSEIKLESNKLQYLQGTSLFPKHLNHIEVCMYTNGRLMFF